MWAQQEANAEDSGGAGLRPTGDWEKVLHYESLWFGAWIVGQRGSKPLGFGSISI